MRKAAVPRGVRVPAFTAAMLSRPFCCWSPRPGQPGSPSRMSLADKRGCTTSRNHAFIGYERSFAMVGRRRTAATSGPRQIRALQDAHNASSLLLGRGSTARSSRISPHPRSCDLRRVGNRVSRGVFSGPLSPVWRAVCVSPPRAVVGEHKDARVDALQRPLPAGYLGVMDCFVANLGEFVKVAKVHCQREVGFSSLADREAGAPVRDGA